MSKEKKYAKLIMVAVGTGSAAQSNKFYEMVWDGGSNFTVNYGRVESTSVTKTYPYYQWDTKYNEKVKKGYTDVTEFVSVEVTQEKRKAGSNRYKEIEDAKVAEFVKAMQAYTDGLVARTYSVKSDKVSRKQVEEAQTILDGLAVLGQNKKRDVTSINTELVRLYTIIPRYIKDVRVEILPHIDLDKTLVQEQDNLDAMRSQVSMNDKNVTFKVKEVEGKQPEATVLETMGVKIKEIKANKDVEKYVRQISGQKVKALFEVDKAWENERFDGWLEEQKNKETSIVIHGTRCTSVIPILEQGLKIRPSANFQFSGKVYGNGNYFSEQCDVSLGYTGWDNDQVLLVYEVHSGKASSNSYHDYKACKAAGYDSYAMTGGGWGGTRKGIPMRVMYREEQSRIKYIIWLKK